jgi:uncharacterized repeat protein (TIGR01451 family)
MKYLSKKNIALFFYTVLTVCASNVTYAAETVCNSTGWAITDGGISNVPIPFYFGDASVIYDVNISTDISHTYIGDLTVKVTSPDSGQTVRMFERPGTTISVDTAPVSSGPPWGCSQNNIVVTFDDEAASGVSIENQCPPATNGTYLTDDPTLDLSAFDGEDPNGDWTFYLSDSANGDTGTLNQACLTVAFAALTFDKWASTNPTCSDTLDSIAVAPGTDVYFCYTASNPSTETFSINSGNATDDQGHNISALETTYLQNDSQTVIVGPIVAGSAALPDAATTVNNANVIATFATANYSGILSTGETASVSVGDPVFTTSTKTVVDLNGGSVAPGDILEYTITINETAGFTATNLTVTDAVQADLESISFTSLPAGTTNNTAGNNIDLSTITVAANGTATIVYEATINVATPAGTNIDNTATITHAGSGVTFDAVAPAAIVSPADLSTSTKTVLDVNGGSLLPGDLVRYTITIIESAGQPASNVQLTDVVDANLTAITITNLGGGTDNSSGSTIDISNISLPASSSVTVVFEANVSGGASTGTSVNNTAIITDVTSGVITNAVAPTIVVGSSPGSGTKVLYLDNLGGNSGDLTRVDPATITDSRTANLNGNGESADFNLTPVFQDNFIISTGTINALIGMERNNNGSSRTVLVELFKVSGGNTLIASDTTTFNIGTNQANTTLIAFDMVVASAVSFSANDSLMMRVTNITGPNNDRVRVHSNRNGLSVIPFDTPTVINLDEVGIYAGATPSTAQFKSYLPGSTVYLRAKVSDPFGFADIRSVDITVTNPAPTQVFSTNITVPVVNPAASGADAVFETAYTIPASPDGIWSIGYTANEGSEGTVSHSTTANMVVGSPALTVSKNSQTILDPVNTSNYKAIPSSIVEYSIGVENSGYGYVDINTTVITDPIAPGTTFYFGSPINPATFVDGLNASGLSFTFTSLASTTDDIGFSNDGGSTFITPNVDVNGFDITSPPINYISLNPKGEFRGSDGVNNPSMQINFRVRVE